jgi:hypothetical protein
MTPHRIVRAGRDDVAYKNVSRPTAAVITPAVVTVSNFRRETLWLISAPIQMVEVRGNNSK